MPSFSCTSAIRVASEDHVLHLRITHSLVHGQPSEVVHSVKGRLPKELDVLWLSDITISFTGSHNDQRVRASDVSSSGLVHHLRTHLTLNAEQLGLHNVSQPFVDDADGLAKLTLTPSRPLPTASRPHAKLVSLHLAYIWKTIERRRDLVNSSNFVEEVNPFSPSLFLPTEVLLNRATKQFLIYHLVSRYPLIFGSWCKRLDLEMQYLPSISRSIIEMMRRSQNQSFLSRCKRLLKIARSRHTFVIQASAAAISSCTGISDSTEEEIDDDSPAPILTDELVLCESLEQLFRVGVLQRRFKPAVTHKFVGSLREDDGVLLEVSQSDQQIEGENNWTELSKLAMSPVDRHRTLQDDLDVFIEEDWPQEGMCMWRMHEEDTRPVHDIQSDEPLISIPDSSARVITTHPPQAALAAHYHPNVDDPELDPVSGASSSQKIFLEDAGYPAFVANLTRSLSHASHDHRDSHNFEQLMHELGTCQVDSEGFESLCSDSGIDGDKEAEIWDSDSMVFDMDDIDPPHAVESTIVDGYIDSDVTRMDEFVWSLDLSRDGVVEEDLLWDE